MKVTDHCHIGGDSQSTTAASDSDPCSSHSVMPSTDIGASIDLERMKEPQQCMDISFSSVDESPDAEHDSDDEILSSNHSSSSPSSVSSPPFSEITSTSSLSSVDMFPGPATRPILRATKTYKFTGDNMDYKTMPRDMREDH